ncbi:MAG: hypothetical protein NUV77_12190 [Thermoguttaceae bacterium]|jgi:hypothetical protein|nr:hypothetical protein [Thermoguttaceae bacterium]
MHHVRLCLLVGAVGWALAAAGCTSLDLADKLTLPGTGPKPKVPTRMTEFWTDTVLYQPGLPGVRGFGGRVMFYNDQGGSPIPVDGTFSVFAYDETNGEVSYSAPDKKFVFPADQLSKHYSKSEFGHSYSFWLPWDEVGGPQRTICLIARFEPKKGPMIVSRPCRKVLPGEPPASERGSPLAGPDRGRRGPSGGGEWPDRGVRQASHLEPVGPDAPLPRGGGTTITIDVPPSFARPSAAEAASAPSAGIPDSSSAKAVQGESNRATSAASPNPAPSTAESRPANRSERRRPIVERTPIVPRVQDPVRRQPLPAAWLPSLPATPRSDRPGTTPARREDDDSLQPLSR